MANQENIFILAAICILTCFSQSSVEFISPKPYTGISSIFVPSSTSMYYHSGVTYDGSYLLGLHRFYYDNLSDSWRSQEQQASNTPAPRSFYGSFLYNNNYYIFGGIGPAGVYNDLWSYDLLYQGWTEIQVPMPISPRYSFSYTSFTSNGVFYFAVLGGNSPTSASDSSSGLGLFDFYL